MTRLALALQPRWRRRLARAAPLAVTALGLGLLVVAACGGEASPSSVASTVKTPGITIVAVDAGSGGTTPAGISDVARHYQAALKLPECPGTAHPCSIWVGDDPCTGTQVYASSDEFGRLYGAVRLGSGLTSHAGGGRPRYGDLTSLAAPPPVVRP